MARVGGEGGSLFSFEALFFPPAHPGICDPNRYVPARMCSVSLAPAKDCKYCYVALSPGAGHV